MAVAHNASGALNDGDSITAAAGTDRLMLHVHAAHDDGARTISVYDLGSTNMVEPFSGYSNPVTNDVGGGVFVHIGSAGISDAVPIPGGSNTLVVTYSQAMNQEPEGDMLEFTVVDQTTPIAPAADHTVFEGTYPTGTGNHPPDMDLDVVDGDMVVFYLYGGTMSAGLTIGGDWGGTLVSDERALGGGSFWSGYDPITATDANYQIALTKSGDNGGVVQAFVIRQAAGGTPTEGLSQQGTYGMNILSGGFRE